VFKAVALTSGLHSVTVDRRRDPLMMPQQGKIVVRSEYGQVVLFVGDKRLEMSTPVAVKVGLAMVDDGGSVLQVGDIVVLEISGFEVLLLPETAMRIGGAILRKANHADDWQRGLIH
jgi:hypothetical protein